MKKKLFKKNGFTLIEVLLASIIIGVVGFILSDILSRSFKSNDKVQLTSTIKQNGQNALNIISETIRNSDEIVCPSSTSTPATNKIIVFKKNIQTSTGTSPIYTRFRICPKDDISCPPTTDNGFIARDFPIPSDPNDSTILANLCSSTNQPSALRLVDDNDNTGVSVVDGKFEYLSFDPTHKSLLVELKIGPTVQSRGGYENQIDGGFILFQTTVQKR